MRIPMIAGNWKMNTTVAEAVALVRTMLAGLDKISNVEKVVCPPFVSLAAVSEIIKNSSVKLGAQNMFYEEKGAYTGEVSSSMLAELCEFVIIGHSERRQYFHEVGEIEYGLIDIEEIYNSSPPITGIIYPKIAVRPKVTNFPKEL